MTTGKFLQKKDFPSSGVLSVLRRLLLATFAVKGFFLGGEKNLKPLSSRRRAAKSAKKIKKVLGSGLAFPIKVFLRGASCPLW
jgi:hypothetical protein